MWAQQGLTLGSGGFSVSKFSISVHKMFLKEGCVFFFFLKQQRKKISIFLIIGVLNYDSQCCVNFWCTAEWFTYTYVILFHILVHYGFSPDIEYNTLCCTVGRTLSFIHCICNSLHLLIPDSCSTPTPSFLPAAVLSSMSVSLFVS